MDTIHNDYSVALYCWANNHKLVNNLKQYLDNKKRKKRKTL